MLQVFRTEQNLALNVGESNKKKAKFKSAIACGDIAGWSETEIKRELKKARIEFNKMNKTLQEEKGWLDTSTLNALWQSLKDWQRAIESLRLCQAYAPLSVEDRKTLFDQENHKKGKQNKGRNVERVEDLCLGYEDFCGASPKNRKVFTGMDEVPQSPEHAFSLMARTYVKNAEYDSLWISHRLTYHRAEMIKNHEALESLIKSHKEIHRDLWKFINGGVQHIDFETLNDMTQMIPTLQRDITSMSVMLELMDIDKERRFMALNLSAFLDEEEVEI